MPRGPRFDAPGRIFHVMNRGIARRTLFERTPDFRYFLSRLARSVRLGQIDILVYALMSTHYHLVIRSHGHLSAAMGRIQGEYSRYFNRSRRRDGPLPRGRFISKSVTGSLYLTNVVPYVEDNPVEARLVQRPELWPWGSAAAQAGGRHRKWLSSDLMHLGATASDAAVRAVRADFIEARLAGRGGDNPFENVVAMAPRRVADWMRRKAALADGTEPDLPVSGPATVIATIIERLQGRPNQTILVPGGTHQPVADLLHAGLLRELAGASHAQVAVALLTSGPRAKRLYLQHTRCVQHHEDYRTDAAAIVVRCLELLAGPASR